MNIDWKQKLSSRKFWALISALIISVLVIFGHNSESAERISGLIMATGSVVAYILAEGSLDEKRIENNGD
jgi:hypothetical protein